MYERLARSIRLLWLRFGLALVCSTVVTGIDTALSPSDGSGWLTALLREKENQIKATFFVCCTTFGGIRNRVVCTLPGSGGAF